MDLADIDEDDADDITEDNDDSLNSKDF